MKFTAPSKGAPPVPSQPAPPVPVSSGQNIRLGNMGARLPCMGFMQPSSHVGCGCGGK
jgi:hypothetical protein